MQAMTLAVIFTSVHSLEPLRANEGDALNEFVQILYEPNVDRRSVDMDNLQEANGLYAKLIKSKKHKKPKRWLREEKQIDNILEVVAENLDEETGKLVENELKNSLGNKKSALLDRPYVAHEGKNDFLVMRPDITDPFVTVIPNSIYIPIEKKCVNWLDDCSLKGIRARLLRGVRSPYR